MAIPVIPTPQRDIFKINRFLGVNKNVNASQIADNEASDMLNFMLDDELALDKRTGYSSLFTALTGGTGIKGLYKYRKSNGTYERLLLHNTKLYRWDDSSTTLIYTGFADTKATVFQLNDKMYFVDGTHFLVYDGTNVTDVLASAYSPTIILGKGPTGTGGTSNEQINLIGRGFTQSYSGNGTATYDLSTYENGNKTFDASNLDADPVVVVYNGVTKTEGTHFTVNRTAGTINFAVGTSPMGAPATGTNNVLITAYKSPTDFTDRKNRILNCTMAVMFGGSNDTRVLLSGNSNTKNVIYRSGLTIAGLADPTYWPENTFSLIGANNEAIMGMAKQYDTLVVFKENSTYQLKFALDETTATVTYPSNPINDVVGIYSKDTLQIIDNNPVFLTKRGVYRLIQSNVRDERNMDHISKNIDTDLLEEPNLENAVSFDFNKKYYICVNNNCYIYDYRQNTWYKWDNITASSFLDDDNYLYFGSNTLGKVYRFKKADETNAYQDDNTPINAYWKSKIFAFGYEHFLKLIDKLYITLKPNSLSSAKIYFSTDKKDSIYNNTIDLVSFDFRSLDFSKFSFENTALPKTFPSKLKQKKVVYFQIEIQNNEVNESLGVLEIGIQYGVQKQIK